METWEKVKDCENYEVSNKGNIKNKENNYILKPNIKNGYCYVVLKKDDKLQSFRVHRLVAEAFLVNNDPENKIYVNHINGDKTDNRVENLEYITPSDNVKHAVNTGLLRKTHIKAVNQYDLKNKLINTFESITEASNETNISYDSIMKTCKHELNSAGGYKWEYKDTTKFGKEEADENLEKIPDYPDYGVSRTGRVYSYKVKRYLALGEVDGYDRAYISNKKGRKGFLVHQIVAKTFIPNPEEKPQVNHKNKNKKDNRVENLEWVTDQENKEHKNNNKIKSNNE